MIAINVCDDERSAAAQTTVNHNEGRITLLHMCDHTEQRERGGALKLEAEK